MCRVNNSPSESVVIRVLFGEELRDDLNRCLRILDDALQRSEGRKRIAKQSADSRWITDLAAKFGYNSEPRTITSIEFLPRVSSADNNKP